MDKQIATQLIGNTFNFPFDEGRFRKFAINLLNNVDEAKRFDYISGTYIRHSFKNHITKYKRLGTYTDPNGDKIDVLVVQLKKEEALERSRTMLRNFTSDYLKNRDEKDAALVAYYTTNPDDWRFSYIRMEYKRVQTDSGKFKIKEDITPAKRYSFLVGKNEPNHTAQEQLVGILSDDRKNPTLSELENAFSVDAVTKQFYKDYRAQFEKLWNELKDIVAKDQKIAEEFETKTIDTANFAKKLMGQIVFLYFLQKKGWLGVGKDENGNFKEWGKGPKNFLHRLFKKEFTQYGNFFNDVLEPLFYEALATERTNDVFTRFNCKIPFLNGGLFEPINDYNWEETDIRIDNDLIGDVLKTFDQYNFTVREDEPLEKEVAVDPEMLGKVFENLLPENLRKGKGAYYTPRTIVHYMCQESLINYLDSVIQSSRLNTGHKPAKKQRADKQDACNTLYFDYESLTKQQKRNLPHWEQDNVAYFVTFRLWDSIPKEVAEKIREERKEWKNRHKIETEKDLLELNIELKKEYYRLFSKRMDDLLDNGHGSCVLKNPEVSKIIENALNYFDGERYLLDHWVIMPNHVHVLAKPLGDWSLEKITHSWKSFTSNEINKILKRDGQLWMHESFDHIVRSPEQLLRIRQYIKDNPKNLSATQYRLKCNSSILDDKDHKQDACDTIPKEDIETLIREGDIILELETAIVEQGKKYDSVLMPSIKDNAQALDDALANIKVCDPAIGSGAFPVGMLTEIVKARTVLSLYLNSPLERGVPQGRGVYNLKRHCIQNSLYGVDIDPGAIEIAKLRLWLSLVVDEDDYTTIQPLPNLDYKIMQGNSLIEEFHGISLDIEKKNEQQGLFSGGSDLDTLIDDLHQKQDDFFNAEHPREKKEKREAVETAIYNIFHNELEKKKSISALEAKEIETDLKEMTHGNKERNFFPRKLYFADVFRGKGGFDVVIANPPYIQLQKSLDDGTNNKYADLYKNCGYETFKRTGDIYALFYELGINVLKDGGHLTFITSNKWMRAGYGDVLRGYFAKHNPKILLDFGGFKVFESATVDVNIIVVDKSNSTILVEDEHKQDTCVTLATHFKNDFNEGDSVAEYVKNNSVELTDLTDDTWFIGSKTEIALKQKIEEIGTPLKDWDVKINYGIKTGYNKAFIIDETKRAELIAQDPKSEEIIKPVLGGKNLLRYGYEFAGLYLIATLPALNLDIDDYPAVRDYLKSFGKRLHQTGEPFIDENGIKVKSRKRTFNKWFETQDPIAYYAEFAKEKVVWLNLNRKWKYSYVDPNIMVEASLNFLSGDKYIKTIVGIMSSKLQLWFFRTVGRLHDNGGYMCKIDTISNSPIPPITASNRHLAERIEKLVELRLVKTDGRSSQQTNTEIEQQIDQLVYQLYDLTDEEIAIVEESVK